MTSNRESKGEPLFSKAELDQIFKPSLAKSLVEQKAKKERELAKQTVSSRPKTKSDAPRDPLN
jgi:hypothetical protein